MTILASALLAGSLLPTGAQARGGGGDHVGGFGGHMGGFGGSHMGFGTRAGSSGPRHHVGRYLGGSGIGLYDDGLGCTDFNLPKTYHTRPPTCS
jgi:hypothetical protein